MLPGTGVSVWRGGQRDYLLSASTRRSMSSSTLPVLGRSRLSRRSLSSALVSRFADGGDDYALQLCARLLDLARDAMSGAGLGDRARLREQRQRLVMVAVPGGNVSQPHQVRRYARHQPDIP